MNVCEEIMNSNKYEGRNKASFKEKRKQSTSKAGHSHSESTEKYINNKSHSKRGIKKQTKSVPGLKDMQCLRPCYVLLNRLDVDAKKENNDQIKPSHSRSMANRKRVYTRGGHGHAQSKKFLKKDSKIHSKKEMNDQIKLKHPAQFKRKYKKDSKSHSKTDINKNTIKKLIESAKRPCYIVVDEMRPRLTRSDTLIEENRELYDDTAIVQNNTIFNENAIVKTDSHSELNTFYENDATVQNDTIFNENAIVETDSHSELNTFYEDDAIVQNDTIFNKNAIVETDSHSELNTFYENDAIVQNDTIFNENAIVETDSHSELNTFYENDAIVQNDTIFNENAIVETESDSELNTLYEDNTSYSRSEKYYQTLSLHPSYSKRDFDEVINEEKSGVRKYCNIM